MKTLELKITRIGNSRGVRLPATTLHRYQIGNAILMEERSDGILLRPAGSTASKSSWEDTAHDMEATQENWSEWTVTNADGLEAAPWETGAKLRVAERAAPYVVTHRKGRRT